LGASGVARLCNSTMRQKNPPSVLSRKNGVGGGAQLKKKNNSTQSRSTELEEKRTDRIHQGGAGKGILFLRKEQLKNGSPE